MAEKSKTLNWLTRTAVILALTLVFQLLRFVIGSTPWTTYIIGSLVNLGLVAGVYAVDGWAGSVVALVAPIMALIQGHAPAPMVPVVMAGNLILVWTFALLKKKNWLIPIVPAALLKYALMAFGMALLVIGTVNSATLATAFTQQLVQLPTAVIGAVLARPVIAALGKRNED
ncbi:MAG: hypothetical protein ACOX88_00640 [Christensenellales bacterium]|jgi:hypothetical protein